MKETKKYIYQQIKDQQLSVDKSKVILKEIKQASVKKHKDIAVIGMAGRFPGASNLDEYWNNLLNEVDCIGDFPEGRQKGVEGFIQKGVPDPLQKITYEKGGYLEQIDQFDSGYFKISNKESEMMDPIQRLLLTTVMESIEDAGYGGSRMVSSRTGVFIGRDHTVGNMYTHLLDQTDELALTGSYTGILSSRISYFLDLKGPSIVLDSACSSGLLAIHDACQAIRNNECDMAIAGGVCLVFFPMKNPAFGLVESKLQLLKPFDKQADGTLWGEGIGSLLLKPLDKAIEDRDPIHAVIKGSAVNNDGRSNGLTAPNALAQEELFTQAWINAEIAPETIGFYEAHGTGTVLGDPIEVQSLSNAFRKYTSKKQFCGIGSVKSNIGHLAAASGIASVMKAILSLKHQKLVSTLHFDDPNPFIDFVGSPIYMVNKLQEWKRVQEDIPLRAGISSFGFSGTNLHLVLEEAPVSNKQDQASRPYHVFTVSAKEKTVLLEWVSRYLHHIQHTGDVQLADLCYTAATGRGHYAYRLALIVRDIQELQEKLHRLANEPPIMGQSGDGIYYGEFKIVPESKKDKSTGETTESGLNLLHEQARAALAAYSGQNIQAVSDICRLYVQGAEIDWEVWYQPGGYRRIPLPVYPFQRTSFWPQADHSPRSRTLLSSSSEGLPGRKVLETYQQSVYEVELRVEEQWLLREHRMMGYSIVPATGLIEWARQIGRSHVGNVAFGLQDFRFINPLIVGEREGHQVHTLVEQQDSQLRLQIASRAIPGNAGSNNEWSLNAEGKIIPFKHAGAARVDIQQLLEDNEWEQFEPDFDSIAGDTAFGPRWNNIQQLSQSNDRVLVHVKLGERYAEDFSAYGYHPALLDTGLNAVTMFILRDLYLPFSFKKFTFYDSMPDSFYSYLCRREAGGDNKETISYDISLFDEQGNVFAEVENYTLKKVSAAMVTKDLFHQLHWVKEPRQAAGRNMTDGAVLLFGDERGRAGELIRLLAARGAEVIRVHHGGKYRQEQDSSYTVGNEEGDYQRLFADLQGRNVSRIIHSYALDAGGEAAGPGNLQALQAFQAKSIQSLFYTVKSLVQAKYKQEIDLVLLGQYGFEITGHEEALEPCQTAFFNLGKAVAAEYPNVSCRSIDLDGQTEWTAILEEIEDGQDVYQVAYRGNERYVQEFGRYTGEWVQSGQPPELQEDGLYLITGGTGGIGLETARYLSSRNKICLGLLSRGGLNETDGKQSRRMEILKEIERSGSRVMVCPCDVTDEQKLAASLAKLRETFGPVKGVIHAAGIAGSGFLFTKSWPDFSRVTKPKIEGTYLLHNLIEEPLDFFMMFSSVATLEGSPGQGDYIVANGYLDGFAHYLRRQGVRGTTLNWAAWEEVGMAVDYGAVTGSGICKPLKTHEALAAVGQAIAMDCSQVMIGSLNLDMLEAVQEGSFLRIEDGLIRRPGVPKTAVHDTFPFTITGRADGNYNEIEQALSRIWAETMHLPSVNIYSSFLDIGGDSLIATQLLRKLEIEFPGILDLPDLFTYSSVAELSGYIMQQRDRQQVKPAESAAADRSPASGDSLDVQLQSIMNQLTSDEQTVEDLVELLSQRRNRIDE
ncbi:SDR family NAD(P)-dependent oxidoreductase [Paenibacillus jilunlii]|uniref:Phosphopantetheine attachment site n=1 Tax=Paenibacillus jilunlii TaxID=682956 RepID=A0A1G9Y0I4_9BACL|nr:SDR family NAD(P)-dependent oxidoreductase [Paenibacillus jilunlii]KWX72319.1 hypothetical protein AML91_21040 [Paenibacillus jilunlii]SDN02540.1 Phosphopantetheine attachment site [Paenibacillus jilunlii]